MVPIIRYAWQRNFAIAKKGKGSLIQPPPFVISYSQSLTVNS